MGAGGAPPAPAFTKLDEARSSLKGFKNLEDFKSRANRDNRGRLIYSFEPTYSPDQINQMVAKAQQQAKIDNRQVTFQAPAGFGPPGMGARQPGIFYDEAKFRDYASQVGVRKSITDEEADAWFKSIRAEDDAIAAQREVDRIKANKVRDQQKERQQLMRGGSIGPSLKSNKASTALTTPVGITGLGIASGKTMLGS